MTVSFDLDSELMPERADPCKSIHTRAVASDASLTRELFEYMSDQMDLQQEFDFFKEYVSSEISDALMADVLKEIDTTRDDILRFHRSGLLCRMINSSVNYGDWVPDAINMPMFILKPSEVNPPKVSPQILQQASHLCGYIHADLGTFLEGLLSKQGTPLFSYAVDSAIPSLFGYFSSSEHVTIALAFYLRVVNSVDATVGFNILQPYLACSGMFKYIESVLTPFVGTMMRDARLKKKLSFRESRNVSQYYAKDLAKLFEEYVYEMPHTVSMVIALMQKQWGVKETIDMIIQNLFKSMCNRFLLATGREKQAAFVDKLFSYITKDMSLRIMTVIAESKSRFQIPELFRCFSHNYLSYYSCVADLEALAMIMESQKKLPVSLVSLTSTPKRSLPVLRTAMFWFKIYPKKKFNIMTAMRPLFFQTRKFRVVPAKPEYERLWAEIRTTMPKPLDYVNGKPSYDDEFRSYCLEKYVSELNSAAKEYEDLMLFRLWLNHLEEWKEIAEEHARSMAMPIAILACNQARSRRYESVEIAHEHACMLFNSRMINQDQFLILIGLYMPDFIGRMTQPLDNLIALWNAMMAKEESRIEVIPTFNQNRSAHSIFWEAVENLRGIDNEPFHRSYHTIISSMRLLNTLSRYETQKDELCRLALVFCKSEKLVSLYLILKKFAMDNQHFTKLCTETEQILWVKFERVVLSLLLVSEQLSAAFFELQNTLC